MGQLKEEFKTAHEESKNDSEESEWEVDDELFDKIMEGIEETLFDDEDAAFSYFENKLEEIKKIRHRQKPPKKAPEPADSIGKIMKR